MSEVEVTTYSSGIINDDGSVQRAIEVRFDYDDAAPPEGGTLTIPQAKQLVADLQDKIASAGSKE